MPPSKKDSTALQQLENAGEEKRIQSKKRRLDVPATEPSTKVRDTESKPSKEERREAKRLKKDEKEAGIVGIQGDEEYGVVNGEKRAAKAARKAEKARLKAGKKLNGHGEKAQRPEDGDVTAPPKPVGNVSKIKESSTGYTENRSLTALPKSTVDLFLTTHNITVHDPSSAMPLRPITEFSYLPAFSNAQSKASPFAGFKSPTPIQASAWPHLLSGRDVIGVAETGSGKTLAFGVPCIRAITSSLPTKSSAPPCRAVVVSPTRELAVQIHTQIEALATPASLKSVCVYGGVPKDIQRQALKTAAIIVATPGRLNDLIEEGSADLSRVTYLVLDEADRMLDKGFEDAIRQIISTTAPESRQTLMFTATWPPSVRDLASTFLKDPVHISLTGANNPTHELRANKSITQTVEVLTPYEKEPRLLALLKHHSPQSSKAKPNPAKPNRILIFALYKKEAARISASLSRTYPVAAIHGDLSQPARSAALESFKTGECTILVATDVAARGLDIPNIELVINYTFPLTVEDYVHRIGRTGRAGREGLAVTFFTEHDKGLAGGLVNVLKAAGQRVPESLLNFGTTVKRKGHEAYGAFYRDTGGEEKKATKIRFE